MARASEHMVVGYTYHLTHRCHDRRFLLRFARDRDVYREWLRVGVARHRVPVYGYCVTSNHVHVLARAENEEAISGLMHLAAGATAKCYNLRKQRQGAMWEHPYQCTLIQDGEHLLNCLCYIDLNMVRAGVVSHPRAWRWCGYDELSGTRVRYRLIDREGLVERLGMSDLRSFRMMYAEAIERRLSEGGRARQPHWTGALAVGSADFVHIMESHYGHRRMLQIDPCTSDRSTWMVKEPSARYEAISGGQNGR
ncbi:MAG TPA: transposase [Kiritimatiellia bacterium]|nr:transposase [Kiritimatiellia bacterium]HMP33539.1 transposase [Kiritimatiellia bacterium]